MRRNGWPPQPYAEITRPPPHLGAAGAPSRHAQGRKTARTQPSFLCLNMS